MHKQAEFIIKGMQKDTSESKFNSEFAYDNRNIRITPIDDNTLLSLVNEKGTKELTLIDDNLSTENNNVAFHLAGTPVGQSSVGKDLILFSSGGIPDINIKPFTLNQDITAIETEADIKSIPSIDNIYRLWFDDFDKNTLHVKSLFSGNLNLSTKYPIETIPFYENEDIQKIYWVDGINPPRVININASKAIKDTWNRPDNRSPFNFVKALKLKEEVTIKKNDISNGIFAPGVIQYAFTYFDKFGQESNIFYTSPLYYISYDNRGANPKDTLGNSFNINIKNVDDSFEYLRIYSIQRTSINSTPLVKNVVDLKPSKVITSIVIPDGTEVTDGTKSFDEDTQLVIYENNHIKDLINYPLSQDGTYYILPKGSDYVLIDKNTNHKNIVCIKSDKELHVTKKLTNGKYSYDVTGTFTYGSKYIENTSFEIDYTDTGTTGETVDSTKLLYVGGEDIIAGTMTQKDNTLFLGDITLRRRDIAPDIKDYFNSSEVRNKLTFTKNHKKLKLPEPEGIYPYKSQLHNNSQEIKIFKYLETYRFGIQFQHYTGKWSEPLWLGDRKNNYPITENSLTHTISSAEPTFNLNDTNVIKALLADGYIKVRPVVVYPTINDRSCICQGVVCPTVYNVKDRFEGTIFSQSSWFTRPNDYRDSSSGETTEFFYQGPYKEFYDYSEEQIFLYTDDTHYVTLDTLPKLQRENDEKDPVRKTINFKEIKAVNYNKIVIGNTYSIKVYEDIRVDLKDEESLRNYYKFYFPSGLDIEVYKIVAVEADFNKSIVEFRHNNPIHSSNKAGAEIQNICNGDEIINPVIKAKTQNDLTDWVFKHSNNYFIDNSIFTFHSPDIEFDNNLNALGSSNVKFRIVGYVPITANANDINILIDKAALEYKPNAVINDTIFYKELNNYSNLNSNSIQTLSSGNYIIDNLYKLNTEQNKIFDLVFGIPIYPFNKKSIIEEKNISAQDKTIEKQLISKIKSKVISNSKYSYNTVYFNNTDNQIWKAEDLSNGETGISGVSIFNTVNNELIKLKKPLNSELGSDISYFGNVDTVLNYTNKEGYPIYNTNEFDAKTKSNHDIFKTSEYKEVAKSNEPIEMIYKSTNHAVIALNNTRDNKIRILPTFKGINDCNETLTNNYRYFWDTNFENKIKGVSQSFIPINSYVPPKYGYLWLGELYIDDKDITNRFGGTSKEALQNNTWLPCGEAVTLRNPITRTIDGINLTWSEGDTYYQRYDHLKTYPATIEETNGIVDIVSFMCETRVNIDGRYDRNRGLISNLTVSPQNFNLLNNVYSQENNYFNYKELDDERFNIDNFRNAITWTKTKVSGELTDTWTNITLASTLDLDGDKGPVRALRRFNDSILAFQDKGISQILYNENTQISTANGVPIEIANSGKVTGKRYISDNVGCRNKWSICESPYGIYFVDDLTKNIYNFSGQLNNISDRLGFHSWIVNSTIDSDIWDPVNFDNIVSYYDKINKEVMFITNKECLTYSEVLGQFTSFYSYGHTPYFININDRGLFLNTPKDSIEYKVWGHNEGDYNYFFDEYKPFSTTVIVNADMPKDKIFDNLEFRSESFDNEELIDDTFDTLIAENKYQHGELELIFAKNGISSLKRKFKIWRANIPRDDNHKLNRIRSPWAYITLAKNKPNKYKTVLHDMTVHYFE